MDRTIHILIYGSMDLWSYGTMDLWINGSRLSFLERVHLGFFALVVGLYGLRFDMSNEIKINSKEMNHKFDQDQRQV
jgi:hypothetical protein